MYVKLFGSILHSSIWSTDLATRVVWITMLAMADEYGIVHAAVSGLAREANVAEKDCRRALRVLASPDKESRSPEAQGRRITAIPGGWRLINYQKYREIRTQRQFADAERQARHREAQRDMSRDAVTRHGDHKPVTDITTEAEAEAEAEAETTKSKALVALTRDDHARGNGQVSKGAPVETIITELQTVGTETTARRSQDAFRAVMVKIAFAYWSKRLGHERSLLDAKRVRVLERRLIENGDNLSELLWAVDGALKDDWIMGRDPRSSKRYDGIETIFQDRAHVEKYAAVMPQYGQGLAHPMATKYGGVSHD